MVKVVVVVVCFEFFWICIIVFIVGCVDCILVIWGNLVSGGVVGNVMFLMIIVFYNFMYVYFDIDEVIWLKVLWYICFDKNLLVVNMGLIIDNGLFY